VYCASKDAPTSAPSRKVAGHPAPVARALLPRQPFDQVVPQVPKTIQGAADAEHALPVAGRLLPGERGAQVVEIGIGAVEPGDLFLAGDVLPHPLRQREIERRVRPPRRLRVAGCRQLLQPVLADRLEHRHARLPRAIDRLLLAEQALVEQRRDAVEDGRG